MVTTAVQSGSITMTRATRIALVDDHVMVAGLLAQRIDEFDDLDVVVVAADVQEAVDASLTTPFDVAVVDRHLARDDGIAVVTALRQTAPDAGLILLDSFHDDQILREAVTSGCAGYVTKYEPFDALVQAIRAVARGGLGFGPAALISLASSSPHGDRPYGLTERELTVLRLLANGVSTQELADRLFVSVTTARNHVQRVIGKLGAHSRLEAVAVAARAGVIPLGGRAEPMPARVPAHVDA
jgi:DNA-binding NarL/FixJ family response regulator